MIQRLKLALSKEEHNAQAWYILGSLYNEINLPECISCYEKALLLNAKCYLARRGLGNYYLKNKEFLKAEDQYTKAIGINAKRYGSIYKNRARQELKLERIRKPNKTLLNTLPSPPNAHDRESIEEAIRES